MRRGTFNRKWIEHNDKFVGVSLGSDYVAEHEWGIKDIRSDFGIRKSTIEKRLLGLTTKEVPLFGIDVRTIHENPSAFFEKDGTYLLGYTSGNPKYLESLISTEKQRLAQASEGLLGLWDGSSFALLSKDKDKMEALRDAFADNDIAIFLGASEVFSNGNGINLCIVSKMPSNILDHMRNSDMSAYRLRGAVDKLGIEKRLSKANRRYHALSPRWKPGTTDEVEFWLNPMQQQTYEAGWYTEAELDEWIDLKGPIMKPIKQEA